MIMATTTVYNHRPMILTTIAFLLVLTSVEPPWAVAQFGWDPPPPADFDQGRPRVDLKMAIVMVLLVTVFFVLGFLSVYTRQCAQERFRQRLELTFAAAAAAGAHDPNCPSHGLPADAIAAFPTFLYSSVKGHKIGKGSLECAVCLSEFGAAETLRLIPKCDHVFHRDCIDAWLSAHATCPVCRANLVPKPGEDHGHCSLPEILSAPAEEPPAPAPEPAGVPGVSPVRPPRSRSTGFGLGRAAGAFPRSLSTGHLPVRQGESLERFTLRLPEDVRSRLVSQRSADVAPGLPRMGSGRRGFRSGSVRRKDGSVYERFDPESRGGGDGRWVFSVVPPFVTRSGSVRSGPGDDDMANRHKAGSTSSGQVGERSTDHLRPEDQV